MDDHGNYVEKHLIVEDGNNIQRIYDIGFSNNHQNSNFNVGESIMTSQPTLHRPLQRSQTLSRLEVREGYSTIGSGHSNSYAIFQSSDPNTSAPHLGVSPGVSSAHHLSADFATTQTTQSRDELSHALSQTESAQAATNRASMSTTTTRGDNAGQFQFQNINTQVKTIVQQEFDSLKSSLHKEITQSITDTVTNLLSKGKKRKLLSGGESDSEEEGQHIRTKPKAAHTISRSQTPSPTPTDLSHSFSPRSDSDISDSDEEHHKKAEEESSGDELDMTQQTDVRGPKIHEEIAGKIDRNLTHQLERKTIKKVMRKYPPPENSRELKVPKTNELIFSKMYASEKQKDKQLQKIQKTIISNLSAAAQLKSLFKSAIDKNKKLDIKKCNKITKDIIQINSSNMNLINKIRRYNIKASIQEDLKPLCIKPNEGKSQDYLFADTSSKLEEINKQNKLLNKLKPTSKVISGYPPKNKTKNGNWTLSHPAQGSREQWKGNSQNWGHQNNYKRMYQHKGRGKFTKRSQN